MNHKNVYRAQNTQTDFPFVCACDKFIYKVQSSITYHTHTQRHQEPSINHLTTFFFTSSFVDYTWTGIQEHSWLNDLGLTLYIFYFLSVCLEASDKRIKQQQSRIIICIFEKSSIDKRRLKSFLFLKHEMA